MEPPVSEPRAKKVSPAATAAHEPPEDPPGTCSVFHGFFVGPNQDVSVVLPIANSSIFVLPSRIAPAFLRFSAASAEYGGTNPLKILELHVVSIPSVQILSLIAMERPPAVRSGCHRQSVSGSHPPVPVLPPRSALPKHELYLHIYESVPEMPVPPPGRRFDFSLISFPSSSAVNSEIPILFLHIAACISTSFYSSVLGTLYCFSFCSGAFESIASDSSPFSTTSSRNTL